MPWRTEGNSTRCNDTEVVLKLKDHEVHTLPEQGHRAWRVGK